MRTVVISLIVGAILIPTADTLAKMHRYHSNNDMPTRYASGGKTFVFSPRSHSWALFDGSGNKIGGGPASGGSNYCPDIHRRCHTPVGSFRIMSKGGPGCISTRYPIRKNGRNGGAHMPYCSYFTTNFAIHGYNHISGTMNESHGCIRVHNEAAQWLSQNINVGTRVVVKPY